MIDHAGIPEDDLEYGVGVRLRSVWVPEPILNLFVSRAGGGAQNYGIGAELVRRRGTTELQIGFEIERVTVGQGVWIQRGADVASGAEIDYIISPRDSGHHLGWVTAEFTFLNHAPLTSWMSFRYGAGLGVGVVLGQLDHYNVLCNGATNAMPEPGCVPERYGGRGSYTEGIETKVSYNLPPVFPVVNAILGLQFKPAPTMTINLEGGIRSLPFFGLSSTYFF